jgi:hypothetical protein
MPAPAETDLAAARETLALALARLLLAAWLATKGASAESARQTK